MHTVMLIILEVAIYISRGNPNRATPAMRIYVVPGVRLYFNVRGKMIGHAILLRIIATASAAAITEYSAPVYSCVCMCVCVCVCVCV